MQNNFLNICHNRNKLSQPRHIYNHDWTVKLILNSNDFCQCNSDIAFSWTMIYSVSILNMVLKYPLPLDLLQSIVTENDYILTWYHHKNGDTEYRHHNGKRR